MPMGRLTVYLYDVGNIEVFTYVSGYAAYKGLQIK
jgi:hypothetical protein